MSNLSPRPMPFLSSTSANAIVSDLRPTSLSPAALHHVNVFLDELLSSLITSAQSINPSDLRASGVPAVFSGDKSAGESTGPRSLGRAAVGEAEMELRSWFDQNAQSAGGRGFPPGGKGRGMSDMKERAEARFPEKEAVQLMRVKVASFSTLASEAPYSEVEEDAAVSAWKAAGGDISPATIDPAGLWITAIIEHVCEHLLNRLSSVVARDSGNAVAGVQDLLTTLYEDETMYGFFKRMKVKDAIENAIKSTAPRSKRSIHLNSAEKAGRASPSTQGSPHASKTSLVSPSKSSPNVKKASLPSTDDRVSSESGRFANLGRKVSSATKRGDHSGQGHERAPSVLSVNTRSMIGAFNESFDSDDSKEKSQDQDDFDALVRSGETMKVSLTPSRLKTFEAPSKGSTSYVRRTRATSASSNSSPISPMPKSESMPAMPKQTTPNRPSHLRSRASSGAQKLVARGATTIDEGEDEDDDLDMGRKPQKESLKELFGSEPIDLKLDPTQRTAPAVVLATPPPRDSSTFNRSAAASPSAFSPFAGTGAASGLERRTSPAKSSINRPGRELLVDDNEDPAPTRKARTETRELPDFFSNTPPPITTTRTPASEPPPSGKSSKSFRSFMSKFTGRKEDEKPHSPSREEIPTAPKVPKRVRSTAGFSSTSATESTRTAPASYTRTDEPPLPSHQNPNPPPHRILRKKSDAATAAAFAAGAVAASALHESPPRGKENKPPTPEAQPTIVSRVSNSSSRRPSDADGMASVRPTRVLRDGPGLEDERIAPTTPTQPPSELPTRSNNQTPKPAPIDLAPSEFPSSVLLATPGPSSVAHSGEASGSTHMERVPTTSSDVNSFITADEGESEDAHATDGSVHAQSVDQQDDTTTSTVRDEPMDNADSTHAPQLSQPSMAITTPPVPSVPLADLVPLRSLFDHSTSVLECKMLLSAILTQFGVPRRPEGEIEVTPETRLAAWLLAGGYGPIDTGSNIGSVESGESGESQVTGGTADGTSTSEEIDEAITPTLKQSAQLDAPLPTPMVLSAQEKADEELHGDTEEELEHSERSSEASFAKDEEVEVGRPSIAKAARRESAMQLPTVSVVGGASSA